jgi:hypothetical protein
MNKQLYKKSRVIHDAPNDQFIVEVTKKLFGGWEMFVWFRYKVEGRDYFSEHHIPKLTEDEAREKAIERAKALKHKTIIWEG